MPLAFFGAVAVAVGAALAQALSAFYLLRLARRRIRSDIPNFFRQMPLVRAALAALVTVVLEVLVRRHVRTGPLGMLECVPAALVGLAVYGLVVVGPRRAKSFLVSWLRRKAAPQPAVQSAD